MFKSLLKRNNKQSIELKGDDITYEARNWYHDRYAGVLLQRNVLFFLSLILAGVSLASVIYVGDLAKKKVIKPYVVQIDDRSGQVKIVNALSDPVIKNNESLHDYFLVKYLKAREGYDAIDQDQRKDTVRLFSTEDIYYGYARKQFSEEGPIKKFGSQSIQKVHIKSVAYLKPGRIALIRFRKITTGKFSSQADFLATVEFGFRATALKDEERFSNPLGFYISRYRVDNEYNNN